ncbi:hypothetical protein FA95DRAFT_1561692 [Auriscalpium vulgare]|uniref:Uncharacterized protein n=1 Tax=Auriscalpium vulgare TaxID=40419 RepID=A0ACB8RLJ1_9AGAM|nr:hypothetical protein FA95DRAFT_1561692 [Auriscalpium vulgare]
MLAVFIAAGALAASVAVAAPTAHHADAAVLSAPARYVCLAPLVLALTYSPRSTPVPSPHTGSASAYPTPTVVSTPVYFTASAAAPVDRHAHKAQAVLQRAAA